MCDISLNSNKFFLSISLLFLMTCSGVALAADDPYLKELEAEVGGNSVSGANDPELSNQSEIVGTESPQKKVFEVKLLDDKPATFKTYLKLPEEEKSKVVDAYFGNDKDMETASRLIFDLYYK